MRLRRLWRGGRRGRLSGVRGVLTLLEAREGVRRGDGLLRPVLLHPHPNSVSRLQALPPQRHDCVTVPDRTAPIVPLERSRKAPSAR